MTLRPMPLTAALATAALSAAGCGNSRSGPNYDPQIPTSWASAVTHPWFPLAPGTTYQFEKQTTAGLETITVEVRPETKVIQGVTATVVWDNVYLGGVLTEETIDWYAQDSAGNVWYLGEDTREWENGQVVSTAGTWEWGVNGALPGIIMHADPSAILGTAYRQEYSRGQAEDWAKVLGTGESVVVPFGAMTNCVKTEDWNALASAGHEYKYYCPQVGFALEVPVAGGPDSLVLVSVTP